MKKEEFVNFIAERSDYSKNEATNALNVITEAIAAALGQGESINLVGFGSFEVKRREAREGRNPQTGKPLQIAASNQPGFRAGKALKDACNGVGQTNKKKEVKKDKDSKKEADKSKQAPKKK